MANTGQSPFLFKWIDVMANTCGVGGWGGPVAGDPDNSSVLSVVSKFGGIEISWTTPTTNGFAVSFTRIYRSTDSNYALAVPFKDVGGNYFFDSDAAELIRPYYYWIQHHSINGTVLDAIGPGMATAKPMLEKVLADLNQQISTSQLAESLRTRIDAINDLAHGLTQLSETVATENGAIAQELLAVRDTVTESVAYINEQATIEAGARESFVQQVNTLLAQTTDSGAYAAIQEEAEVRARETGELFAQKTIKLDLAGNVSGLGFAASVDPNGDSNSEFQIAADSFALTPPVLVSATAPTNPFNGKIWRDTSVTPNVTRWYNSSSQAWQTTPTAGLVPFTVRTTPTVLNGYTIEPGVYMPGAVIDIVTANQIDSRGLALRDSTGNIVVKAGSAIDWSKLGGAETNLGNLGFTGDLDATNGAPAGTLVGGEDAATVSAKALGALQETGGTIAGRVNLQVEDGLFAGSDLSNGVYLGSNGLIGKKGGKTKFQLATTGDVFFAGELYSGSVESGKYFRVTDSGDVYAPGFQVVNGVMGISQANVISTLQIQGDAVIVPRRGIYEHTAIYSNPGNRVVFSLGSIDFTYGGKAVFFIRAYIRSIDDSQSGQSRLYLRTTSGQIVYDTGTRTVKQASEGVAAYPDFELPMMTVEHTPASGVVSYEVVCTGETGYITVGMEVTMLGCKR
jgi:hypothetical protein